MLPLLSVCLTEISTKGKPIPSTSGRSMEAIPSLCFLELKGRVGNFQKGKNHGGISEHASANKSKSHHDLISCTRVPEHIKDTFQGHHHTQKETCAYCDATVTSMCLEFYIKLLPDN